MKKFLVLLLLLTLPFFIFSKGNVGLSFGPSFSYYDMGEDKVFSNELAIRITGSTKVTKRSKLQYAVGFDYPAFCTVNWENVGLVNRRTDLSVEFGYGLILPVNSRVEMDLGAGLSYHMGSRPLKSGERVYQYGLNLDAFYTTLFEVNPVFGITMELKLSAPLYLYSAGSEYKKHSSMSGLSALGSVGFVYLYNL